VDERSPGDVSARMPGHYGAADTAVTLRELVITTAWNVHGDLTHPPFRVAAESALGVALPPRPNSTLVAADWAALWVGPRSWLVIANPSPAAATLERFVATRDALNAAGGALFDVSASRVAFAICGRDAAAVLSKTCPLDLHPRAFPAGTCAQSVAGHIAALLYKADDAPTFVVMVARSMAGDAWGALCAAAGERGYAVLPAGHFDASVTAGL